MIVNVSLQMHRLNETLLARFLQCNGYVFYCYQIMGQPDRVLLQEYKFYHLCQLKIHSCRLMSRPLTPNYFRRQ
jgi:G:T-mismatch repair DNA endonuclease (very short patch repair protein)